jgi:hypothetical protein
MANSFLVARRNWENVFNPEWIKNVINTKQSESYQSYSYVENDGERYAGKGFLVSDRQIEEGTFIDLFQNETFDITAVDEEWSDILKQMIAYCDEKGVELTLLSVPVSSYRLMCYQDYDSYISLVRDVIAETGKDVEYVDFNLLKEEYWEDTSTLFMDFSHLNEEGAEQFSRLFCRYVNGELSDEELFYDSVSEKYESVAPKLYGVEFRSAEKGEDGKPSRLIINRPEELISRITVYPEDQEPIVVKDWNLDVDFQVPVGYNGKCVVETKCDGDDTVNEYTIYY